METFYFIVALVKLGNILIRGIIDISAYLKKRRLERSEEGKQAQKTKQP
jgi:hypothetical protein